MEIVIQTFINGLAIGAVYALVATSFAFAFAPSKFFNLAHGAFCAVGGYGVYYCAKLVGLPLTISIILGVLIAGLTGYVADRFLYRGLRRKKASPLIQLVASLGLFLAIQSTLALLFSSQFQTYNGLVKQAQVFHFYGAAFTSIQLLIFVLALLVTVSLILVLRFTSFGKSLRAISDDYEVAQIIGINTDRLISSAFFISSCVAGLAGILVGFDRGISPTMGFLLILKGVVGSIVGGLGSVFGAALGAFIIGVSENLAVLKFTAEWKDAIAFIFLILFLLFRPRGIIKT